MARPVVDLPQPDSPTSPSVSPSRTKNEIPSTALTSAILRWKRIPEVTGKYIFSASTSTRFLADPLLVSVIVAASVVMSALPSGLRA